ncbi:MAG: DNRLRE domain-containing protein [Roseiflexaceae bacterium]
MSIRQPVLLAFVLISVVLANLSTAAPRPAAIGDHLINLPMVVVQRDAGTNPPDTNLTAERRVHAPYFASADIAEDYYGEMAIFWYGKVDSTNNHTDVRVAFSESALEIITATFDRWLWYDETPTPQEFADWDSVSVYLSINGGDTLDSTTYRFDAQLSAENQITYQAAYRGTSNGWEQIALDFTTKSGWRGESLNKGEAGRGWSMNFRIPFASLGLENAPVNGTIWRLGMRTYDRDNDPNQDIAEQFWPPAQNQLKPSSWGALYFGLPTYSAPSVSNASEVVIKHRLNGADVPDGMVGGGFDCGGGGGPNGEAYWTEWGNENYEQLEDEPGNQRGDFNVQNQRDVADWPCFSKNYITFPLSGLPAGKQIVSAKLVLHQFANSQPEDAQPSLMQVMTVAEDWDENTITWNTAPLALENVGRAWVAALPGFIGFPGASREIDVSWALAQAYEQGTPFRIVLYTADRYYHSGKYFIASDTGDWNEAGRPALVITLGDAP